MASRARVRSRCSHNIVHIWLAEDGHSKIRNSKFWLIFVFHMICQSLHVVLQVPLDDPDDTTCMTFVLNKEDHTLGNALRYIIMKKYAIHVHEIVLNIPINYELHAHIQPRCDILWLQRPPPIGTQNQPENTDQWYAT